MEVVLQTCAVKKKGAPSPSIFQSGAQEGQAANVSSYQHMFQKLHYRQIWPGGLALFSSTQPPLVAQKLYSRYIRPKHIGGLIPLPQLIHRLGVPNKAG